MTDFGDYDFTDYNKAIEEANYHHDAKKRAILRAIEALIIINYPKEKIAGKVAADLKDKASRSYINLIAASMGLTDQKYNPKDIEERLKALEKNAVIVQNQDGTLQIMEDPDPSFLSLEALNSSRLPDVPSGVEPPEYQPNPYEKQNAEWIEIYTEHMNHAKDVIGYLRANDFERMIPKEESSEAKLLSRTAMSICKQIWDNRNTTLIETQWKLHELVNSSTIKNGAKLYLRWLKEKAEISSKQITKILRGWSRDVAPEYEPATEEDAHASGFSGSRCPDDGSWRVKVENGVYHCYKCEKDWLAKSKRLASFKDIDESEVNEELSDE